MLASGYLHGAQDVVDAAHFNGFSVERSRPAWVVYLAQYGQSAARCLKGVVHFVGRALDQADAAAVEGRAFQHGAELGVGHGRMLRVEPLECSHLFVGILHKAKVLDEPAVAVGVSVLNHLVGISSEENVFCVEHVQHGSQAVAWHTGHVAFRLVDSTEEGWYLIVELAVDEVLNAMELRRVVAAHVLVEVGRVVAGFVEGIALGHVQHAIVALIL